MEHLNTRALEGRHEGSPGRKPWEGFKMIIKPRRGGTDRPIDQKDPFDLKSAGAEARQNSKSLTRPWKGRSSTYCDQGGVF